ncbi:MAG: TolC family protein [Verrucomicrobia bacterium]|nr:TolC family protein [Verrucomicrobiota bacterium]
MKRFRPLAAALGLLLAPTAGGETLSLDACLREVMERNPEIARARADVERAQGQRLVFRARGLPRLRFDAGVGYQGSRGAGRPGTAFAAASGNFAQPLFDVGIPPSFRRGEMEVLLARQNFFQAASSRLYVARLTYQALQRRRALQALESGTARRLEENARVQSGLEAAGLGARRGTLQAQVQRLALEPQRAANAAEIARLTAVLGELMGRSSRAAEPEPVPLGPPALPELAAAALVREALEHRPDLQAARTAVRIAADDQRIVEANWYPLVELRLGGTAVPESRSAQTNPNAIRATDTSAVTEFRYGLGLSWVPFDGGSTIGQARNAAANRAGLEIGLQRAERQVQIDLGLVQARLNAARSRLSSAATARSAAAQTVATINDLLQAGKTTQLEVLNAQSALLEAEASAINATVDAADAAAELDRIAGRYIRFVREARTSPTPK